MASQKVSSRSAKHNHSSAPRKQRQHESPENTASESRKPNSVRQQPALKATAIPRDVYKTNLFTPGRVLRFNLHGHAVLISQKDLHKWDDVRILFPEWSESQLNAMGLRVRQQVLEKPGFEESMDADYRRRLEIARKYQA